MAQKIILIIDDNEDILDSTRLVLEAFGYDVMTAKSHLEIDGTLPDLILLDFRMPVDMDSSAIIKEFRSCRETSSIPIILFSAINDIEAMARSIGADDYLPKPFNIQTLRQKLEYHLAN